MWCDTRSFAFSAAPRGKCVGRFIFPWDFNSTVRKRESVAFLSRFFVRDSPSIRNEIDVFLLPSCRGSISCSRRSTEWGIIVHYSYCYRKNPGLSRSEIRSGLFPVFAREQGPSASARSRFLPSPVTIHQYACDRSSGGLERWED